MTNNKTNAKEFADRLTRSLVEDVSVALSTLTSERYITANQNCDVNYETKAEKLDILDERIGELSAIKTRLNRMLKDKT